MLVFSYSHDLDAAIGYQDVVGTQPGPNCMDDIL